MKIKDIKDEIDRIACTVIPKECESCSLYTELQKLDRDIKATSIKISSRKGNYIYFYPYTVEYQKDIKVNREKLKKPIGKMLREVYEKKKKIIKAMNCEELEASGLLEKYEPKNSSKQREKQIAQLLKILESQGESKDPIDKSMTVSEIATRLNIPKRKAQYLLMALIELKKITRVRKGSQFYYYIEELNENKEGVLSED